MRQEPNKNITQISTGQPCEGLIRRMVADEYELCIAPLSHYLSLLYSWKAANAKFSTKTAQFVQFRQARN